MWDSGSDSSSGYDETTTEVFWFVFGYTATNPEFTMSLLRFSILGLGLALHAPPALADLAEEVPQEDTSEDTGESDGEGGCMAAAVNPTTLLSVGLGVGLLFGLRRRED